MYTARLASVLPALVLTAGAQAQLANGSFETLPAFTSWTTTGTVALSTTAPAAPTDGDRCALLTAGPTSAAALATFLGCTVQALAVEAATTTPVRNGSAISQTFTVAENDTLMFDFEFNNAEVANDEEWPDSAFVIINGEPHLLGTSATSPHGWTGQQRFSKSDLPIGQITVAFAVCNFNDLAVPSQLKIDNVMVMSHVVIHTCGAADIGSQGGLPGFDLHLDNNDFVVFVDAFFQHDMTADLGGQGGVAGADGQLDNNDFVAFIDAFFSHQGLEGC